MIKFIETINLDQKQQNVCKLLKLYRLNPK